MDVAVEEDDEVVEEFDVVLSGGDGDDRQDLFSIAFPLRKCDGSETMIDHGLLEARYKKNVQSLEMKMALDTNSASYSKRLGEQIAANCRVSASNRNRSSSDSVIFTNSMMDHQLLYGHNSIGQTPSSYVLGTFSNGKLHLIPLTGSYQMQPSFSYLDGDEKRRGEHEHEEGNNSTDDSETESSPIATTSSSSSTVKALRVRFAREETERGRKRREASSLHRHTLAMKDAWIPLVLSKDEASRIIREGILSSNQHQHQQPGTSSVSLSADRILRASIAVSEQSTTNSSETMLSADLVPMAKLREYSPNFRVSALLAKAQVMSTSIALEHLEQTMDENALIEAMRCCSHLVQGIWVLHSDILHPMGTCSPLSAVNSEVMCRARDMALYYLATGQSLTRKAICQAMHLSLADVTAILEPMCRLSAGKPGRWLLKMEPDEDFMQRHQWLVEEERQWWEQRWQSIQQRLREIGKQCTQRKRNSSSRRMRRSSIKQEPA